MFRLNESIAKLDAETRNLSAELEYHRSINEDAQRDASYGNHLDREEAKLTAADVRRFENTLAVLVSRREKLVVKRDRLIASLSD